MKTLELFVATFNGGLNGGEEYFEAYPTFPPDSNDYIKSKLFGIVERHGILSSRKNPKMLLVNVYSLRAKDRKLTRSHHSNFEIYPPLSLITPYEFNEEQDKLLKDIPKEFHRAFSGVAWNNGHSAGLEEVILVLSDLIFKFTQPIKDYEKRLVEECNKRNYNVIAEIGRNFQ